MNGDLNWFNWLEGKKRDSNCDAEGQNDLDWFRGCNMLPKSPQSLLCPKSPMSFKIKKKNTFLYNKIFK
ncbi:hypothetical protein ABPG72_012584 [Tetrahymena utriculariae]